MCHAVQHVAAGQHDPLAAHSHIKDFYNWQLVTERTEKVYMAALNKPFMSFGERVQRYLPYTRPSSLRLYRRCLGT
jgi:phosphatidylinositol glycan class A protein